LYFYIKHLAILSEFVINFLYFIQIYTCATVSSFKLVLFQPINTEIINSGRIKKVQSKNYIQIKADPAYHASFLGCSICRTHHVSMTSWYY